ncbi:MAG: DEAD/DEAH box helicase family protein [Anaerovoracaceae bacterium]
MSFLDISIKTEYRSLIDDMVNDFYTPLLNESTIYKRAVGFFSSSALIEISKGISELIKNGGKIQLVASPKLSEEDIEAIEKGFEKRKEIIENCIERSFEQPKNIYEERRLNLLANLIANGQLDIKIAFLEEENSVGMFHEKMGIMTDHENNTIAFAGSMNESKNAFSHNYESIDVFCSWTQDKERVWNKESAFASIWGNCEPHIKTIDFPKVAKDKLQKYKKDNVIDTNIDHDEKINNDPLNCLSSYKAKNVPTIPPNFKLYEYQTKAIEKWKSFQYKGIFDMATGTGKTYTGLGALTELYNNCNGNLAVIIACPYQHLVEQWVEDIELFNITPIIGFSGSPQRDWRSNLSDAIRNQKLKVDGCKFFCFICTNATYTSDFVQNQISKIKENTLILVDEAHNFGAVNLSTKLLEQIKYRLALSATLDRHNDEEGTAALYNYFGEKCIEYPLEKAIKEGKLTPYRYYPIIVTLDDDELESYNNLSSEMAKNVISKNGKTKLSKYGEILALKRARIVAAARQKIERLRTYITPYKNDNFILVYCGATSMLSDGEIYSDSEPDDLRQIEVVTDLLGNQLNMKVSQFTSKEDVEERAVLKKQFEQGKTLQALIAIKCLDEGVNIPKIKTAFILASTTNPKEYIQRRGRVLRKAQGKEYAEIYDFVTLPRPLDTVSALTADEVKRDISLVKNELNRIGEFARISLNSMEANSVIWKIKDAYNLYDEVAEEEL